MIKPSHVLDPCMERTTCTRFDSPVGRVELIRGQRLADVELTCCNGDHAIAARFKGPSTSVRYEIGNGPTKSGPVPELSINVLPAGRRAWHWDAGVEDMEMLVVFLAPEMLDECVGEPQATMDLRPALDITDPDLWATLTKIKRTAQAADGLRWPHRESLLRLLASEVARSFGSPTVPTVRSRGGLSSRHARLVKDHLAEHFARTVRLEELAALVHLNRSHLCAAFRQTTGLAPHQFQTACRIDRAKQLLAQEGLPLAEVALAVGYSDQSQFGAVFRKAVGCSPGHYRRQALALGGARGAGGAGRVTGRRIVGACRTDQSSPG